MIEIRPKKCWVKYAPPAPPLVGFEVERQDLDLFHDLLGKPLDGYVVTVKKKIKKSRDMNNYMWALCDQIASTMQPLSKEDVYQMAVREVGLWNDGTFANEDIESVISDWEKNGIGWFAEVVFRGGVQTVLRLYRGSSVYNGEQLYRLVNKVVDMAQELGIETITDGELKHLQTLWEGKNG